MARKTVSYTPNGIAQLPNDKPALYRIFTEGGKLNYAGVAKRGRVPDRIVEHIGEIPGAKVQIEQFRSIDKARASEARVIARNGPKYNQNGQ